MRCTAVTKWLTYANKVSRWKENLNESTERQSLIILLPNQFNGEIWNQNPATGMNAKYNALFVM